DHVTVRQGDAHAILGQVAPVDRVILDLPHSAMDYLGAAFQALGARGPVHVYGILEAAEEGEARNQIQSAARTGGFRMKDLSPRPGGPKPDLARDMTPETNRLAGAHREPGRGRNPILWRALLCGRDDHLIDGDVVSVRRQIARIEGIDRDFALSEILQHVGI